MSRWKRLSQTSRRTFIATVAFLALAALAVGWLNPSSWAAIQTAVSTTPSFTDPDPDIDTAPDTPEERLEAPMPPPQQVLIQRLNSPDGNVLVTVQLSAAQIAAKQKEGTEDFITIGNPEHFAILRDDGQGEDVAAGDGLFSAAAFIDEADLKAKADDDTATINAAPSKDVPVFEGRAAVGVKTPQPFNFAAFDAGQAVEIEPSVVFVEPESGTDDTAALSPSPGSPTPAPGSPTSGSPASAVSKTGLRSAIAPISSAAPVVLGTNLFQERVLVIRNTGVVNDPNRTYNPCTGGGNPKGVWTFNHLMTQMANQGASGIDPSDFVLNWLQHWLANQVINADTVPRRLQMQQIINQWPKLANGKLDLSKSPMRLLAIMPRPDLRRTSAGGGGYAVNTSGNFLDAGELRFIFGFVLPPGWDATGFIGPSSNTGYGGVSSSSCRPLPFSVIFEYRVPKCHCEGVKEWARRWVELRHFVPGQIAYNRRLEALTEEVVIRNANPARPNGSALGQLRTNEVALVAPWELREFQLTQFPFTFLRETTVEDTPEDIFNNNAGGGFQLRNWILQTAGLLPPFEGPIAPVPLFFGGGNYLAGNALVPEANPAAITFHLNTPGINPATNINQNWARHRVSRASCNGCHRRETFTSFVHVDPSTAVLPATISRFLTGINGLGDPATSGNVANPALGLPTRNFDDLARREIDVQALAKINCARFRAVNGPHVRQSVRADGVLPPDLFAGQAHHHHISVAVDDLKRILVTEKH